MPNHDDHQPTGQPEVRIRSLGPSPRYSGLFQPDWRTYYRADSGQPFGDWLRQPMTGAGLSSDSDHAHDQELARGVESRLATLYAAASAAVANLFGRQQQQQQPTSDGEGEIPS